MIAYAADQSPSLRRVFLALLRAAFAPEEVEGQLAAGEPSLRLCLSVLRALPQKGRGYNTQALGSSSEGGALAANTESGTSEHPLEWKNTPFWFKTFITVASLFMTVLRAVYTRKADGPNATSYPARSGGRTEHGPRSARRR
ncbi:MAG: hypothetical protein OXR73_19945 [Myxococcales bacterium]|nr:hypothetical protein [Myxococcales bacterium]